MSDAGDMLSVENLTLAYGRNIAVEAVTFRAGPGECLYVVGSNGSGKSTLFKGILGLLRPVSGRVVNRAGAAATAFLPQEHDGGSGVPATVREVVLSGCQTPARLLPFYTRDDRGRAARSMEVMGVADLADRPLASLSGGQRRRALLARCLCRKPRLLLLDEPYNGLDPEATTDLDALLARLRTKFDMTILVTSHDLVAAAQSERVLEMQRRLVFDGAAANWAAWRRSRA